MERARTEWLRSLGLSSSDLQKERGITFVVSKIEIAYKRPAFLDDILMAEAVIEGSTERRLVIRQNITRDDKTIAEASAELAMIDMTSGKGTKVPDDLLTLLLS